MAGKLKEAIQATATHIFSGEMKLSKDWKDVEALVWSTTCQLDAPLGSPKLRFPIHFLLYLDNGRWTIDKHQLEAALGLWLWSLNNHRDYPFCVKSKIAYAAEQSRKEELKSAIRLWVTQSSPINERNIRITAKSGAEHSTTPLSTAMFNMAAVDGDGQDLVDWVILWTAPTVSSLELLAQDLFTIFFNRIAQILELLTGVEPRSRKRQGATIEISNRPTDQPFLGLTEPNIDILAEKFIEAGLGSREDALTSIVPSLLENKKLPSLADVAQQLLAAARAQRRSGNLHQCEDILQGLLHLGPHDVQASAVRHLGELYRFAIRSKKDSDREFGRKGLKELCSMGDLSDLAQEAQDHYKAISERFAKDNTGQAAKNQATYQLNPYLWHLDLESEPTRPFALLLTTDYDFRNAPTGGPAGILKWAIERNCPELIEDLWHISKNLIAQPIPGSHLMPLFWAVECDSDMETFQSLLDWPGAKPEWDDHGNTLLVYATMKDRLSHLRLLLQAGWDVNVQGGKYGNALQAAAVRGNDEIVELLLQSGANINAQGGEYENALQAAAHFGTDNVVKHLLKAGLDMDTRESSMAFQVAVRNDNSEVVDLLIQAGLDVNTLQNGTALQLAVGRGNVEMVDLLRQAGLDVKTHDDGVVLQAAVGKENVKMVELLIRAGLDVNIPSNGKSLQVAVRKGNATIVELLLQAKLDVKAHDNGEILRVAVDQADLKVVDLLLKAGLDINTAENSKVLQAAIRAGNLGIQERLLLQPGINVNVYQPGETLKAAAEQGSERIMELLLQAKIAVDVEDYGEALRIAATQGPGRMVDLLLEAGKTIDADNDTKYGGALAEAVKGCEEEFVARLLQERSTQMSTRRVKENIAKPC
jgi:ankyrin repeat protein